MYTLFSGAFFPAAIDQLSGHSPLFLCYLPSLVCHVTGCILCVNCADKIDFIRDVVAYLLVVSLVVGVAYDGKVSDHQIHQLLVQLSVLAEC